MAEAQEYSADIRDNYLDEAGNRVARRMLVAFVEPFQFLTRTPGAGHLREHRAKDRPILFWPMRNYLDLFKPQTSGWRFFGSCALAPTCPA
jgi:hypothetical protein